MIALDTNVLVHYLTDDDQDQSRTAKVLLEQLTTERQGFVCREVMVELVWVLERTYRFPRDQIATVLEALVAIDGLEIETAHDVARAAHRYRRGGPDFSDLMILAAAERSSASPLHTFDRALAKVAGATLLGATAA